MDLDRLISQLKVHEGVRDKVYLDTEGIETIGVGRNLKDKGLSEDEIDYLLQNDISEFKSGVQDTWSWWDNLDDVRQRVVVDMAFNMGVPRLCKFKKMWSAIEEQRFDIASMEMMDSRWARQVGRRAVILSDAMKSGEF